MKLFVYYESRKRVVHYELQILNVVYYESMKRKVKTRPLYECRCNERLKTKDEESTLLVYTVFLGELEYPKDRDEVNR